jgi:hypothetical protein
MRLKAGTKVSGLFTPCKEIPSVGRISVLTGAYGEMPKTYDIF